MSEYWQTYQRRINHLGRTPQERAKRIGILEFERNLKYNAQTQTLHRVGKHDSCFQGIVLTDKQDENRVSQVLLTRLEDKLAVGELIYWDSAPWLVWRDNISSYQPYNKYYMVKCNYEIKWVDKGDLHKSWAYILGSKDSKIQDNFRTWNSLITPQPNKHIRIIMPKQYIPKGTEIIVGDENWYLVDYDVVSVPEIIFMSFTEGKYNELRDDLEQDIANVDKLNKWKIELSPVAYAAKGDTIHPVFSITKNGEVQANIEKEISYVLGPGLRQDGEDVIVEMESGETSILIKYKDVAKALQTIYVGSAAKELFSIIGDDSLRVTYDGTYSFVRANSKAENPDVQFELEPTKLAKITKSEHNTCVIHANDLNKTGTITVYVIYNGERYEKEISIISLWQVK